MINITNSKARQNYLNEMIVIMKRLEYLQAREIKPVLNRQFMNAAKSVASGMMAIDYEVDRERVRLITLFQKHYKRVATIFSKKVFDFIDENQKGLMLPSEIKAPKEEFWQEVNKWNATQATRKIKIVNDSAKKAIRRIVSAGMGESLTHKDIAKNIREAGKVTTGWKALRIARTETHTAGVKAVDSAIKSTRIEMEREWVSARDNRTRSRMRRARFEHLLDYPMGPNKERTSQDGSFVKTGESLKFPGDPSGSGGNVINCLTSYKTSIFTSKGWRWVKNIKPGDLVLTHNNRFKPVLRLNQSIYSGEVVTVELDGNGKSITVTPEHPFLLNQNGSKYSRWIKACDIKKGDAVNFLAGYCECCGRKIPYYNKFCNISCSSKVTAGKQWKDPKHRKNMSKKASAQMKREYENGTRNPNLIVKKAHKACFKKYGKGGYIAIARRMCGFEKKRIKAIEKKYGSVLEMLKQGAFKASGKLNRGGSKIEIAMADFLKKEDKEFIPQFQIGRRRVDFYIEAEKLFIEVDGYPWHQDKKRERKRDLEILSKYPDHRIAHVTYKTNPPKWEFFDLISLNHTGTFGQIPMKVRSVSKRQLKERIKIYNFAVKDDESYIAKGFVTHNCRCVVLYHTVRSTQPVKPYVPPAVVPKPKGLIDSDKWDDTDDLRTMKKQFKEKFKILQITTKGFKNKKESLDVMNKTGAHFAEVMKNNPGLKKPIEGTKSVNKIIIHNRKDLKGADIGETKRYNDSALGIYVARKRQIHLTIEGLNKPHKCTPGVGNFAVGDDYFSTARHEWGHHLGGGTEYSWAGLTGGRIISRKSWQKYFDSKSKDFWMGDVSRYSATNANEAFAEVFSAFTSPKYGKPFKLPIEIHNTFTKKLKPKE